MKQPGGRGADVTLQGAVDAFLSSPRCENHNTRRAYAGVIDKLAAELGAGRELADVADEQIAAALEALWATAADSTWNRNRAAVNAWLNVEGYSQMNEDAFARRYYADRMELTALGVAINVERPVDGVAEQETYSLRRESFHLPPIAFTDSELAGLHTALSLLDGEFAYAEPLRLALQQLTFGRESPLSAPGSRTVGLAVTASAGGHDARQRLAKIETALERRKTVTFEYESMSTGEQGERTVDPYHLLFRGEFYLLGYCHGREAVRVFRLSRIRSKVGLPASMWSR